MVDTNIDELTTLCLYNDKNGTSLAGLSNAAKLKGLESVGMKISIDDLTTIKCPAIAHLWGNHFVVVESESPDKLRITNAPAGPLIVSKEDFRKIYSGFALLIAKDKELFPKSEVNGSDLRVDGYTWDFEVVEDGKPLQHTFTIRNAGNETLVISRAEANCSYAAVALSKDTILPAEKAEAKLIFDPRDQKGPQNQTVNIHSNDPITPVVQIQITGVVQSSKLLYSPRNISLGEVERRENPCREIILTKSGTHPFEIEKASSDVSFITTTIATHTDNNGYVIKLDMLTENAPVGELKGIVTIFTNHPKVPKIEVPVTATIKGNVEIFPQTLFFGICKKGKNAEKSVALTMSGKEPLKIEKVDNCLKQVSVAVKPKVEGKEYLLTATLSSDAPSGYINGEVITVHTNDREQSEIKIPVYALVEE